MDKVEPISHLDTATVTSPNDIPRVTLTWENLDLTISKKVGFRKHEDIRVLKDISGYAKPGELLAVMGTSGAGKSSLLSVLSGWVKPSKDRKITGDIKANGVSIFSLHYSKLAGNVLQEDILLSTLTVKETIQFSADLRTPYSTEEKARRVNQLIDDLRLTKCKDTLIGSQKRRGISGGEKKRVCIGIELITNPSLLFLDEPTSGLDSYTALAIMKLLKDQANLGRTIICTLHQPSSQIVELIDSLLVMTNGYTIYHNPPELIKPWFKDGLKYKFPKLGNPIDILMHIITQDDSRFESRELKNEHLLEAYKENYKQLTIEGEDDNLKKFNPSLVSTANQYKFLLGRSIKETFRNRDVIRAKIGISVIQAAIIDMLYYKLSDDRQGIQNRYGLFFMLNIVLFISGIITVVLTFPLQRSVFLKEQGYSMYGAYTYFWAKLTPEIYLETIIPTIMFVMIYWATELNTDSYDKPLTFWGIAILAHLAGGSIGLFMGCIVSNVEGISAFIPMVFFPNLVYSGFLANFDSIPIPFRYLTYISPFRYCFTSMSQNEYHNLDLDCDDDEVNPCTPLSDLNIDISLWRNIVILGAIVIGFRLMASLALKKLVHRIYA
mmetsp:Transcript_33883/g.59055  ORF Transcript_33883/g.59055 Transcript_33883/m.59055 type:complete len:608 (-) Transcript_33883:23-1846(-)